MRDRFRYSRGTAMERALSLTISTYLSTPFHTHTTLALLGPPPPSKPPEIQPITDKDCYLYEPGFIPTQQTSAFIPLLLYNTSLRFLIKRIGVFGSHLLTIPLRILFIRKCVYPTTSLYYLIPYRFPILPALLWAGVAASTAFLKTVVHPLLADIGGLVIGMPVECYCARLYAPMPYPAVRAVSRDWKGFYSGAGWRIGWVLAGWALELTSKVFLEDI